MTDLIIIGADSFIGLHLKDHFAQKKDFRLRLAAYDKSDIGEKDDMYYCNLLDPATLRDIITTGSCVINLAYLWGKPEEANIQAVENLLEVCCIAGIKRLIHISTAFVAGRAADDLITEKTNCRPANEYEKNKLSIERYILGKLTDFEKIIIRPTVVFGPDGKNLLKMIDNLLRGNRIINYVRSCLFKGRTMNLVSVKILIDAIEFILRFKDNLDGEVFIISEDENPENMYYSIESIMMNKLNYKKFCLPIIGVPEIITRLMLFLFNKSNLNPRRRFDGTKLSRYGFEKKISFQNEIINYMHWFKKNIIGKNSYLF